MNSRAYLTGWRDAFLTLVYPRGCQLCGASVESAANGTACGVCWSKAPVFSFHETLCQKCGRLLENAGQKNSKTLCHRCDKDSYEIARAVGSYNGALRLAVLELKEKPFVPLRLEQLLLQALNQYSLNQSTKIIPVPLHIKRQRERGFNQAAVLAQNLSRQTGLPVLENCLTREIYTTQHRGAMDERARRESVESAFVVKQPRLVENQKILLVDDVFTSGATASACAQALKEKGASEVFVLTIARAV